jgi:hypothetical protein
MEREVTHLQFGSPFHLNAFSVQAAEAVQDAPLGLPVVLWDVPNGMSGGSRSGRPDELVPATTAVTSAAPAAGRHSPLGCVTFCIRGRTCGEMQPDAEDAEQIVAHAGGHCLLMPIACGKSDPAGNEAETAAPMTLTAWLKLARRESTRKAPLPRHWQSLSLERLAELAEERGLQHSEESSKIQLVKFLRDNWSADN